MSSAPMSHRAPGEAVGDAPLRRLDQWALFGLLDGTLPRPLRGWARRRVAADPGLREAYEQLRAIERLAADVPVSAGQARLLEDELFARLAGEEPSRQRVGVPLAFAAAAAGLAAFLFLPGTPSVPGAASDELQARSAHEGTLGASVRCMQLLEKDDVEVLGRTAAGPGRPGAPLTCPRDALLGFSFTNLRDTGRHVLAVGVGPDDELRWYAPFGPDARSAPVPAGTVDRLLDTAADLSPMPVDERIALYFLFSEAPLDGAEVERTLNRARQRGLRLYALSTLPIPDAEQARIEVHLEEGRR